MGKTAQKLVFLTVVLGLFVFNGNNLFAQGERQIIQFSGVVVEEDPTSTGLMGVHVYVPKAGRGAITDRYGYFSMPVLVGDSVLISAVGYQKQHFIIPGDQGESFTVLVELAVDTTLLPSVEIFPFPTEELFKEALVAMNLPVDDNTQIDNLGEEVLARISRTMPMDGSMNHKYYMDRQFYSVHDRYSQQRFNNPLLNPANWASFIKSLRNGDLKKKKN